MSEKIYISAERMEKDTWSYGTRLFREGLRFDGVIGVMRGGSQIAVYLHEVFSLLQEKMLHFGLIQAQSYTGIHEAGDVRLGGIESLREWIAPGMNLLIVDDVFDRGKTLDRICTHLQEALAGQSVTFHLGALYYKPENRQVERCPDSWYREFAKTDWLVFPHELIGLTQEERRLKGFAL